MLDVLMVDMADGVGLIGDGRALAIDSRRRSRRAREQRYERKPEGSQPSVNPLRIAASMLILFLSATNLPVRLAVTRPDLSALEQRP